MSSLMMKASMVSLARLVSVGKPNPVKKRVDAARSFTGRLIAILVDIGPSVVLGGSYLLKNAVSGRASGLRSRWRASPDDRAQHRRQHLNGRRARAALMGVDRSS